MEEKKKDILLFDGVCNLCNGAVRFLIKRDAKKKFLFASLQSDAAQHLLEKFGLSSTNFKSIVLISEDRYFEKSTAVLRVLKRLGGFWSIFYVFIIVPRPIRDFFYDLVARSRYRIFGKRDTCMIPTADTSERFL